MRICDWRCLVRAAFAIVVGLLTALHPAAAELSPALAQAVAAANQEGSLKLIWAGNTLGGAAGAKRAEEGMRKAFGTTFSVRFAPSAGAMDVVGSAILAELKADRKAGSDIYLGPTTFVARFAEAGMFQSVDWPALLPGRITPDMVEANGEAIRFVSFVAGITYNNKLLPAPPKTVEGWLDPTLKGKLASTPSAAGFDVLAASDFWGEEKTLDFTEKFSNQIAGLIRCGNTSALASGEFWALMFDCGGSDALLAKATGAPIDQVVATDFVQICFFYMGVPKNAGSPNAAKVFIAYMMTPEGQNLAWNTWREDLHTFPELNIGKQVDALRQAGANPRVLDIKWTNNHPETGVARPKILKLLEK